jgi:hypothetical protein
MASAAPPRLKTLAPVGKVNTSQSTWEAINSSGLSPPIDWAALADTTVAFLSNPLTSPELVDQLLERLQGPRGSCFSNKLASPT